MKPTRRILDPYIALLDEGGFVRREIRIKEWGKGVTDATKGFETREKDVT